MQAVLSLLALTVTACGGEDLDEWEGDDFAQLDQEVVQTGVTYSIVGVHSNKCVEMASGSPGADVVINNCNASNARQHWRFESMGSGWHRIRNVGTNRCADVWEWSTQNGARIAAWDCTSGNNQQFRANDLGNTVHELVNRHSGQSLDVYARGTADGTRVIQWPLNGGDNQRFRLAPIDGSGGSGGGGASCPVQLEGWAAVGGDGVATTTGGGNASPVRPTTVQQLQSYASDGQARVIEILGTFNVPLLDVRSNKTLVGIGNNATINGGIRIQGSASSRVRNVIIRNLRINARTSSDANDNDGIQLRHAHHVWVDHCEIWDAADGNLDIVRMSDYVTVSWTKFWYSSNPPNNSHRFCNLIGNGDNNTGEDRGRLNVTMHHNWWAERVHERMPRVRFGQVHVYNNYFTSSGNNYCVCAGREARLLVQNNYFHGVRHPHEFNSAADQATAHITAQGNTYDGGSGTRATGGGGVPFTNPPYSYNLETASAARQRVQACAGPR